MSGVDQERRLLKPNAVQEGGAAMLVGAAGRLTDTSADQCDDYTAPTDMIVTKTTKRSTYSFANGTNIAVVTPGWRVKIFIPPLPLRNFTNRSAAEQHAAYFAHRACAQAAGYSVHRSEHGRYAFTRPDGSAMNHSTHVTEGGAWFAAHTDSTGPK